MLSLYVHKYVHCVYIDCVYMDCIYIDMARCTQHHEYIDRKYHNLVMSYLNYSKIYSGGALHKGKVTYYTVNFSDFNT